jgi:hypothetical protein
LEVGWDACDFEMGGKRLDWDVDYLGEGGGQVRSDEAVDGRADAVCWLHYEREPVDLIVPEVDR